MKRIFSVIGIILVAVTVLIFATSCDGDDTCAHEWGEWVVIDQPTCTKGGYSTRTCGLCGESSRTVLYPSDHTYAEEWSYDGQYHWRAATCQHADQKTDYSVHEFDGQTCIVCTAVKASQGLQYRGDSESGTYIVIGLGTTLESDIVVARYYNGYDIVAVGERAFANAKGINSIWLQPYIKTVGDRAFENSTSITEVTLCYGTEYLGSYLFSGCTSLEKIVFRGTMEQFNEIEKAEDWDGGNAGFLVECFDGTIYPPEHTYSDEWSFNGTHHWRAATCEHADLVTDYAPHEYDGSACTSCGAIKASQGLAYKGNLVDKSYTLVGLGTTLETDIVVARFYNGYEITGVEAEAFANTPGLRSVWLQGYIRWVGDRAFAGSADLVTVTLTYGTERLGTALFDGCTSLEEVIFRGTVAEFEAIEKADGWDSGASGYVIRCYDGEIQK